MRISGLAAASGLVLAAALVLAVGGPASAQLPPNFNPAKPFAGVAKAEDYVKYFKPGAPHVVPGDAFGNMTSGEFWRTSWQGAEQN